MKLVGQGRKANSWFESIGGCNTASVVVALQARMAFDCCLVDVRSNLMLWMSCFCINGVLRQLSFHWKS